MEIFLKIECCGLCSADHEWGAPTWSPSGVISLQGSHTCLAGLGLTDLRLADASAFGTAVSGVQGGSGGAFLTLQKGSDTVPNQADQAGSKECVHTVISWPQESPKGRVLLLSKVCPSVFVRDVGL